MFTMEKLKAAHAKVKTGADYPNYIQVIIGLGVTGYETYVSNGNTVYFGAGHFKIESGPKYIANSVAENSDPGEFLKNLKAHQQGKTNFPSFCLDCAKTGVEKWTVDMSEMTCTYYDKAGTIMLIESIPIPA
jgi:uncharacterized protein YbcV (DUF1398 family)